MEALQHSNKRILFNLLPAHVATHFLDNQFRNNMVSDVLAGEIPSASLIGPSALGVVMELARFC